MLIKGNLMKHERITLSENIKSLFLFVLFFIITIVLPIASYNELVFVFEALNKHPLIFNEKSFSACLILYTPAFAMLTLAKN